MMDLDRDQLLELIPHRPPILMLDAVTGVDPGVRGSGVRTFTAGDPWFSGHFPGNPVLPGVLTIEAFAQTALVVAILDKSRGPRDASRGRLAKCREVSFLHPIVPGTQVIFSVEIERRVGDFVFADGTALVDGLKVSSGKLTLRI